MAWDNPFGPDAYQGRYTNDAGALAEIQARHWDSTGDGLGTPIEGQWYVNTAAHKPRIYLNGDWYYYNEAGFPWSQAVFLAEHGDNTNDGLSPGTAVASPDTAQTKAAGLSPATGNRVAVISLDGATHTEGFTVASWTRWECPNNMFSGAVTVEGDSTFRFNNVERSTGTCIHKSGGGRAYVQGQQVIGSTGAHGLTCATTGQLSINVEYVSVDSGTAIGGSDTYGLITGRVGRVKCNGGYGIYSARSTSQIWLTVDGDVACGSTGTCVRADASGAELYMRAAEIEGSSGTAIYTSAGTDVAVDCPNVAGTITASAGTLNEAIHTGRTGILSRLTEESSPADNDWLLLEDNATGELKKVQKQNVGGGGGQDGLALVWNDDHYFSTTDSSYDKTADTRIVLDSGDFKPDDMRVKVGCKRVSGTGSMSIKVSVGAAYWELTGITDASETIKTGTIDVSGESADTFRVGKVEIKQVGGSTTVAYQYFDMWAVREV